MSVKTNEPLGTKSPGYLKYLRTPDLLGGDSNLVRLFIIMVIIFIFMSILKPNPFLTLGNFSSMAFQIPEFGIMAIAMMTAMLTGGIDLSIVGIANLSGILSALILVKLVPADASIGYQIMIIIFAIFVAIIIGVICGLFNGFAVSKIGIPPILATLGTMQLFMGTAIVITEGKAVLGFPESFSVIGNGEIGPIPVPMIFFVVIAALFSILFNKTQFGIKLYMMGTNPTASRFSGINNTVMLIKTYLLSGVLAAVAGLIVIARTNSAKADYGTSYTLQAVLVAVMGGVNPSGGFGKILGIVMAMLTLQFLSSGFNAMHFSNFFKDFTWGLVLIVVMVVNYISDRVKARTILKK